MIVLVSDTCVLVDLEHGGLLIPAFGCGLRLAVPDMLYEDELANFNGPYLRSIGLDVLPLTSTELALAQGIQSGRKSLSFPDCFALALALRDQHALLTGDRILRRECTVRGAQVYGLLWLLDQMYSRGVASDVLYQGLSAIKAQPTCRLPKDELARRLADWGRPPT